jgi:acetolactate synthase-1/2/3 large subunit
MSDHAPPTMHTVASHLMRAARACGAEIIFTNLGSDHPAFIQAFAELEGCADSPAVICCPHEMTALSAAHGHAMLSRRAQLVLVHVDVGTQNLGSSVHNAARGRVPAVIIAGLSPVTLDGDKPGTRTEYIHFTQDTSAQTDIVRPYMKWMYELRAATAVDDVVARAFQIAHSEPQGPVYLTGGREIWEEAVHDLPVTAANSPPATLGGLPPEGLDRVWAALRSARRPLCITSHLGRQEEAVPRLVALSERIGLPVQEVSPQAMNFPGDHPHHAGYERNRHVAQADCIIVLDCDVPWMPQQVRPAPGTPVFVIDLDPLKEDLGLWRFPTAASYRADAVHVLDQLNARAGAEAVDLPAERREWLRAVRAVRPPATVRSGETITVPMVGDALVALIDAHAADEAIVLMECPTSAPALLPRLRMRRPGSFHASGGSGLGWGINAAIGAKLARPQSTVISLVGDGSYLFGVPSSTYWVSRAYDAPTLTVIFNNGGWNAPKRSNDLVHADGGPAGRSDRYWITVTRDARLADIAAAAGQAEAFVAAQPGSLLDILQQALQTVQGGRSAVVDVRLAPISMQRLGRQPPLNPPSPTGGGGGHPPDSDEPTTGDMT